MGSRWSCSECPWALKGLLAASDSQQCPWEPTAAPGTRFYHLEAPSSRVAGDPRDAFRAPLVTQGNPSGFKGPLKDSLGTHPTFTIQHSTKAVPKGSQLYDAPTKTL